MKTEFSETNDRHQESVNSFFGISEPLRELRSNWKTILSVMLVVALLAVLGGVFAWLYFPIQRTASIEFQFEFSGAADNKYPNGTRFSPEDLLIEPVVRQVFNQYQLGEYTTFAKFRQSLFVTSASRDLELLEFDYRARLSDVKLPITERQRLEREYREKVSALKGGLYRLTILRQERMVEMGRTQLDQILRGILSAWAEDAANTRGGLKYDIPIFTKGILQRESLASEDYVIAVDILRRKINRVIENIDALSKIPGIQIYRLEGSGVSLPEIRIRLEDLRDYRATAIMALIREKGYTRNLAASQRYIAERISDLGRAQILAQEQESKVRAGLEAYVRADRGQSVTRGTSNEITNSSGRDLVGGNTVIPQFGESFIDRLMELTKRNSDTGFRQGLTERMISLGLEQASSGAELAYYRDLQANFRTVKAIDGGNRSATVAEVERNIDDAIIEIETSLSQVAKIYELISSRNLFPPSNLFLIERPIAMESVNGFSILKYVTASLLFVFVGGLGAVAIILLRIKRKKVSQIDLPSSRVETQANPE